MTKPDFFFRGGPAPADIEIVNDAGTVMRHVVRALIEATADGNATARVEMEMLPGFALEAETTVQMYHADTIKDVETVTFTDGTAWLVSYPSPGLGPTERTMKEGAYRRLGQVLNELAQRGVTYRELREMLVSFAGQLEKLGAAGKMR